MLVRGLTVLKLGGSVITKKDKALTPNLEAIRRLAREIKESSIKRLVVVHGGGSFGHPLAKKYEIAKGYKSPSQLLGLSKTHQAMIALNKLVLDALIGEGVLAIPIQPSACLLTENGRICKMETSLIAHLLELGTVPVLYGDVCLDTKLGFTVVSGDQLTSKLAIELGAERVIVCIDVNGLYTADPFEEPGARLIEEISPSELRKIRAKIRRAKAVDVTGGMIGKVAELATIAERGVPVFIVNGLKPGRVRKALLGERVIGTVIKKHGQN